MSDTAEAESDFQEIRRAIMCIDDSYFRVRVRFKQAIVCLNISDTNLLILKGNYT